MHRNVKEAKMEHRISYLGAGVTGDPELLHILCKSSVCSQPLSHLSNPLSGILAQCYVILAIPPASPLHSMPQNDHTQETKLNNDFQNILTSCKLLHGQKIAKCILLLH